VYEEHDLEPGDKRVGKQHHQGKVAYELKDLYLWWVDTRPARIDPYQEAVEGKISNNQAWKLEQKQQREDDKMLLKLIKLRHYMWT
jgi:hypothetical protein